MFLPQQERESQQQPEIVRHVLGGGFPPKAALAIPESSMLLRLKTVNRLSIAVFWFLLGDALANISRFLPSGWIIYLVFQLGAIGYLVLAQTDNATESVIATRRIIGFALFLSCVTFWDWVITVINLPIYIFSWIVPVWQCAGFGVVGLMLAVVFVGLLVS